MRGEKKTDVGVSLLSYHGREQWSGQCAWPCPSLTCPWIKGYEWQCCTCLMKPNNLAFCRGLRSWTGGPEGP